MTPSPTPERFEQRLRRFLSHRLTLTAIFLVVILLAGGSLWAWLWIRDRLVPLIENNLRQLLGRPVELGAVQQISLTGIQFGESALPATPTDPDRASIESVEVGFSPLKLLLNRTLQLNVTLVEPDAYIEQAKDGSWLSTTIQLEEGSGFLRTDLQTIRIRDGDVVLNPLPKPGFTNKPIVFQQLNGVVRFLDNNQRIQFNVRGEAVGAGPIRLAGETRTTTQQTSLMLEGQNLPVTSVGRLADLPIALRSGRVDANLKAQLAPKDAPEITGIVNLKNVTAALENLPQPFSDTQGRLRFLGDAIAFDNVRTRFGTVPAQVKGQINLEEGYDLIAQVPPTSVKSLLNSFKANTPVPVIGTLQATLQVRGPLQAPIVQGKIQTLRTVQIDRVPFRSIQGQFQLTTSGTPRISLSNLSAIPQAGGAITGSGQVRLGQQSNLDLTFLANEVPGDTVARLYDAAPGITIGDVSAIARVTGTLNNIRTAIQFRVPEATYPGRGELVIAGQQVRLQDAVFRVAGGTVQAQGQLVGQQIRATVNASEVALNQFSQDLRGRLTGTVQLTGTTDALELESIQARGNVRFSQGLAVVEEPLTAQFRWNGEQLIVQQASAPGLSASGTVAIRTEGNTPQLGAFNLAVQAQGYNLQDFNLGLPANVALVGEADFNGRVTGTASAPNAQGALRLENLRVNGLAFDPVLAGEVSFQSGQQTNLELSGQQVVGAQDQIALTLGPNNRPTSFLIRRDEAIATGKRQGENLLVDLQNIPIALVRDIVPGAVANLGPIAGDLSGDLTVNLADFSAQGRIAIANPQVAGLSGDVFQGQVSFTDGVARLTEGELIQGDSRIALGGRFDLEGTRPVNFQINFDETQIQNLLQALNSLPLGVAIPEMQTPTDAGAAALQTVPIDFENDPIIIRLQRLAEIENLLAQQQAAREEDTRLPELNALQGRLNGSVTVTGSLQNGLDIVFDLRGKNWEWGRYDVGTVVAQGRFADGTLTVQPLLINTEEGGLAFNGQLGQQELSGQLVANDLSLELLRPFLSRLPVNIAGNLDAIVNLAGSLNNPEAVGQLELENATLSNQPIQQAQLEFRYTNARLNFDSDILVTGTSPVALSGSIPIALPFADGQPTSDQIQVSAKVVNEGLSFINLLTDQITWVDGQGSLEAVVTGTLNQPIVQGAFAVQSATLQAQALPDPLTNLTGTAQFNRDRILVQSLQAQYNQQPITVQGVLPVSNPNLLVETPLTIAFNDLTLNLQDLYQGSISGDIAVRGAALEPVLGGRLRLSNGQVRIGQAAFGASDDSADSETASEAILPTVENLAMLPATFEMSQDPQVTPIAFNNLRVTLGDDVQVTLQPILRFETEGDFTLNGNLRNLRPEGVIRLTRGQISLFTTEFRLARGYEQTVQLTPEAGLDPILDLRLVALVPEATGFRLPTSPNATEILDPIIGNDLESTTGTLRTIRVTARVEGPVSELDQNLELSSSPNRSEAEIVALIGGSFIGGFGQGDALLGAANLAGNTLFRSFQGSITDLGQAIGLSDLRVYSTLVTEPTSDETVLGLATEAVVDVSNDLSVSVSRVFAADQPFRFNVLYRLNDQILMRGSTNLEGDSRFEVEYEARF